MNIVYRPKGTTHISCACIEDPFFCINEYGVITQFLNGKWERPINRPRLIAIESVPDGATYVGDDASFWFRSRGGRWAKYDGVASFYHDEPKEGLTLSPLHDEGCITIKPKMPVDRQKATPESHLANQCAVIIMQVENIGSVTPAALMLLREALENVESQ